jgi:hypothetical protein
VYYTMMEGTVYWKTQKATFARDLVRALLAALSAAPTDPLLATPKLILFTDGPTPTPDFDPSAYIEPTFHGYTAAAVTLSAPVNIGGTDQACVATVNFVATTGGTINDTCNGYMLVDTTKAIPYMIELFANPITFGAVGDFLQLDLIVPLPMIYTPTVA